MHCAVAHLNSTYSVFIFCIATTVIVNIAATTIQKKAIGFRPSILWNTCQNLKIHEKTVFVELLT